MKRISKICTVLFIGLLYPFIGQISVNAQSTTGSYSVTVNTPGTFGQIMVQTVENWSDVVELTISGHLNSADMAYFSRLQNITTLDVSNTDITSITGCNGLSLLESITLPATVTRIEDKAFYGCSSLSTIALNNIESIGSSAFYGCTGLTGTITGTNVKTIGSEAFYNCDNITSISFPVIVEIEDHAFAYSGLSSAEISNVKYVGSGAFEQCYSLKSIDLRNCVEMGNSERWYVGCFRDCVNLTSVVLSDELTEIPYGCFSNTGIQQIELPKNLTSIGEHAFSGADLSVIDIPEGVKTIAYEAFYGCPLVGITLPSTLESIEENAFYCLNESYDSSSGWVYTYVLKDVYCKSIVPIATSVFDNDMVKYATLHVPALSVSAYKLDDNWYKFNKIEAIDGDISDITINNNFTIIDYSGLADNANLTLSSSQQSTGHLTISGDKPLSLNNYIQNQNFKSTRNGYYDEDGNYTYRYSYPYCTTLIANNEVRANNVTTKMELPTNTWSFISLPYDVAISSIVVPEGIMYVVRKYNGSNRAAMSGETWEDVTAGETLNAGEGYIFHCISENGDSWNTEYVEFEFPAVNNSNKNNVFRYNDVVTAINEYPAEFSHNRGWNLIGNPYPSYLGSRYIDFPAPITVWNGNGYTAYSLADDEYILRPNEAFFVQCPVNTNQITFSKDGRTHDKTSSSTSYSTRAGNHSSEARSILNFVLADENYSDRARLVLNESASYDYEIERDASKFMSHNENAPQIYIVDNGINYAIDERPLGTGEYALGIHIGKEGNHSISLNSLNSDYDVLLIDNETNETTNLTTSPYSFEATPQTVNDRFIINIKAKEVYSSIDNTIGDTLGFSVKGNTLYVGHRSVISLYSIDGKLIYSGEVEDSVELPSGIYLLSINNATHKITIK